MVLDFQRQDPNDHGNIRREGHQLGVGDELLRLWVKRAQIDAGILRRPHERGRPNFFASGPT